MAPRNEFTDPEYLRKEQYRDGSNLRQRISLHERFSTNPVGWHSWVFAQLDLPSPAVILETGCGPGFLWSHNLEKIPRGWTMILSDLSPGMVAEAKANLHSLRNFSYLSFDIQRAPLPPAKFDAVIANHMLYHVPDLEWALATIHRILKPGGKLYATTNGETHLREIAAFVSLANPDSRPEDHDELQRGIMNFSLESGRKKLEGLFEGIEVRRYPDSLRVEDPEAIVQFVQSSSIFRLPDAGLDRLRELLRREVEASGAVAIRKDSGMFIARKSDGA